MGPPSGVPDRRRHALVATRCPMRDRLARKHPLNPRFNAAAATVATLRLSAAQLRQCCLFTVLSCWSNSTEVKVSQTSRRSSTLLPGHGSRLLGDGTHVVGEHDEEGGRALLHVGLGDVRGRHAEEPADLLHHLPPRQRLQVQRVEHCDQRGTL